MSDPTRDGLTPREQFIWDASQRAVLKCAHTEMDEAGAPAGNKRAPWLRDHVSRQNRPADGYTQRWEPYAGLERLKTPGGWLVKSAGAVTFIPDAGWTWGQA